MLRQVGGVYQFRHITLLRHLAGVPITDTTAPAATATDTGVTESIAATRPSRADEPAPDVTGSELLIEARSRLPTRVGPVFLVCWLIGLVQVVMITVQHDWGDPGAWSTVGFLFGLPILLALLTRLLPKRYFRLRIGPAGMTWSNGRREIRLPWDEIALVSVHRIMAGQMETYFYGLYVSLRPGVSPPPRVRVSDGRVLVCGIGSNPRPRADVAAALVRFAGPKWIPPEI